MLKDKDLSQENLEEKELEVSEETDTKQDETSKEDEIKEVEENNNSNEDESKEGNVKEEEKEKVKEKENEKLFTQEEVNEMIRKRIERVKPDEQVSEQLEVLQEKLETLETRELLLTQGVHPEYIDDFTILLKNKKTEDDDTLEIVKDLKERYSFALNTKSTKPIITGSRSKENTKEDELESYAFNLAKQMNIKNYKK